MRPRINIFSLPIPVASILMFGAFSAILLSNGSCNRPMKDIVLDFEHKTLCYKGAKIEEGGFFTVKVSNLNLNNYEVIVNSKDTLTSSPIIEFPGFSGINAPLGLFSIVQEPVAQADATIADKNPTSRQLDFTSLGLNPFDTLLTNTHSLLLRIQEQVGKVRRKSVFDQVEIHAGGSVNIQSQLNQAKTEINQVHADLEAARGKLIELNILYYGDESITALESEEKKGLLSKINQLTVYWKEIAQSISADEIQKILAPYRFEQAGTIFTSLPIQYTGREQRISISIRPKFEDPRLQAYSTSLTYPFRKRLYAGVGPLLYLGTLGNETFELLESQAGIRDSIAVLSSNNLEGGVGMAARVGTSFNNWFGVHVSIGSAVAFGPKTRYRLLLGGGLSFGNMHAFVVDAGFVGGPVERINPNNQLNHGTYILQSEQLTVEKFKVGFQLSIGYAFKF